MMERIGKNMNYHTNLEIANAARRMLSDTFHVWNGDFGLYYALLIPTIFLMLFWQVLSVYSFQLVLSWYVFVGKLYRYGSVNNHYTGWFDTLLKKLLEGSPEVCHSLVSCV